LKQEKNVYYYLILSFIASFFLLIISFFPSSNNNFSGIYDKYLVVLLFVIICLFGISLAFYPRWYKRFKTDKKAKSGIKQDNKNIRHRKGHHPDCDQFKKHTLKIKNKTICAGCTGLALGSVISIILILIYLFLTVNYPVFFHLLLILGLIMVFQIYLEIVISIRNTLVHSLSNALHVVGFFLITISIFEITGSVIYSFIAILFSFLFLDTRIQLSSYNHSVICKKCKEDCKMY
jgi:hypothetical protein